LDDKNEARADGGRRFLREGPATETDAEAELISRLPIRVHWI